MESCTQCAVWPFIIVNNEVAGHRIPKLGIRRASTTPLGSMSQIFGESFAGSPLTHAHRTNVKQGTTSNLISFRKISQWWRLPNYLYMTCLLPYASGPSVHACINEISANDVLNKAWTETSANFQLHCSAVEGQNKVRITRSSTACP